MSKSNLSRRGGDKIYLDYAASVGANPSSIHSFGIDAKRKLSNARMEVAKVLGSRVEEIIFTSGGTESNNLAIQGVINGCWTPEFLVSNTQQTRYKFIPHIITTNIEHPSVLETFRLLEKRKLAEISIVHVEANGIIDPRKIKKEIKENTVLVSVMYANNEIGTIQPIKEIAKEIRHFRKQKEKQKDFPFFHTDAVQAGNYLDLNVDKLGVDLLTLSGSKIEGAGKVGVLYKRRLVPLENVFGGGDQESGLRPGTENLPEILKFSTAIKLAEKIKNKEIKRLTKLRDYFLNKLFHSNVLTNFRMIINGSLKDRLPNNVNISFPNIPSDLLVIELSAKGIMVSSKSACKSSKSEGSYVIKAIHPEINSEIGGVRFSFGRNTKKSDIDYVVKTLFQILTKLKKWYN
ncbi:MAG: cysteine desulfurase family protein [Candidatus Paceibacterota bacterium]